MLQFWLQQSPFKVQPPPVLMQVGVCVPTGVGVARKLPPITKSGPPHPASGNASIHSARTITNPVRTIMDSV